MSTTYQDLTYTTFPDTIQSFVEMEDITSGDASALDAYQTAMRAGDFQAARQALASMTNANNKIIDATKINTLNDTLIALERFYKTDIEPYVDQKQEEWQAIVDLFTDNFAYIGEWNSTTAYKKNNIVSRVENPAQDIYLYIAMVDNTGVSLDNTSTWRVLTVKGDIGVSGEGLTFYGMWVSTKNYIAGDLVSYNNHLYMATGPSLDAPPNENQDVWTDFGQFTTQSMFLSEDEPANIVEGQIWLHIIPEGGLMMATMNSLNPLTQAEVLDN